MHLTRTRTVLIAASAVGVAAAVALALPAGAAVTTASPPAAVLKLGPTATLVANGAAVFATIKVTCQPGATGYASVTVAENVAGGFIASGSGSSDAIQCTGRPQTINQSVIPDQRAFAKGTAFGSAHLSVCDAATCYTLTDEHVVQIKP
jgi:hypothetical protein